MNIWIINPHSAPPREGASTRHFDFAKRLTAMGNDVTLIASSIGHLGAQYSALAGKSGAHFETIDGVRFLWIPGLTYRGNSPKRLLGMLDTARRIWMGQGTGRLARPDVIVGSSPTPFGAFGAMLLARRLKTAFVLEVRDIWPASITTAGRLNDRHPLIRALLWMEQRLYKGAREIVTLLPGTAAHIVRRGGEDAIITVIPNGADLTRSGPPMPQPDHDGLRIVYIGTVGLWYGIDTAIETMALLKDHPDAGDISMTFIGGGTEEARLKADAEAQGLSAVQFFSRIPKSEVPARLAQYDACLAIVKNAPLYNEGGISLNKLFDYFAAARPVLIASSAYNDPVAEGGAGLSSPGGDAEALAANILKLAAMTCNERAALGLSGRSHVEKVYNFDDLARQFETVLVRASGMRTT